MDCKLIRSDAGRWPDVVAIDKENLRISFRRTIRVPDNQKTSLLPPDLGTFPLYSVEALAATLPQQMAVKGGLLFPMHDCEAMWVRFTSEKQFAIKIYVGSINAVSGEPAMENMATKLRRQKLKSQGALLQDYVVTPQQLWLDGVATAPGQVRQFVAVSSGSGFSVEAQVTGEDAVAGLQFEVTKRSRTDNKVLYVEYTSNKRAQILVDLEMMTVAELSYRVQSVTGIRSSQQVLTHGWTRLGYTSKRTLEEVGICENDVLNLRPVTIRPGGELIYVKTLTGPTFKLNWDYSATVNNLKSIIEEKEGIPANDQRLIFAGKTLEDNRTRSEYNISSGAIMFLALRLRGGGGDQIDASVTAEMAIGAGGLIKQSIHRDPYGSTTWDRSSTITFNVQIPNAKIFQRVTGKTPPKCPVNASTYFSLGLPFFDIPEAPSAISGNFSAVQSLGQLEGESSGEEDADDECGDFYEHQARKLTMGGPPKIEFRTVREIEDEVAKANVVSFGK